MLLAHRPDLREADGADGRGSEKRPGLPDQGRVRECRRGGSEPTSRPRSAPCSPARRCGGRRALLGGAARDRPGVASRRPARRTSPRGSWPWRAAPTRSSRGWTSASSTTRPRKIFAVGYRLDDYEGPGRLDSSYYDLLASEARLASFVAIAKGDVPVAHWFVLGRPLTSVEGVPTLLSWSATLFEYLMPLLVMRTYPGTLLDRSCRMAVRRQQRYAEGLGVPWGVSESGFSLVDRHGNYQYKAFGVPGLGLKRGLADDLVVAPYATALASLIDPEQATDNLRRLRRLGLDGRYGFFEAVDFRPRDFESTRGHGRREPPHREGLARPPPGHDPGRPGQRPRRRRHGGALPLRRPACRRRSCSCRSACPATSP